MKRLAITANWLTEQHWNKNKSIPEICKEFNFGRTTIYRYAKKFGVVLNAKSRSRNEGKYTKEELYKLYVEQDLSQLEIANIYGVTQAAISPPLMRFGLTTLKKIQSSINYWKLYTLYYWQGYSLDECGRYFGCTKMKVQTFMKNHDLPLRPKKYFTPEQRRARIGKYNGFFGKRHSIETREKLSVIRQKVSEDEWVGFRQKRSKHCKEYVEWRTQVFERDEYKCLWCLAEFSEHQGSLQGHHIKRWADYPDLRYKISNGLTLCRGHHKMTINRETEFEEFLEKLVLRGT